MLLDKVLNNYVFEITLVITLVTFFAYFCYTYLFIKFATSVLGKLVIVMLIIFYTSVHKVYGVLFCLLVISFYQMENVKWVTEGFFDTSSLYLTPPPTAVKECGCNKCHQCDSKKIPLPQKDYLTVVDLEENIREKDKTEFQKRHCTVDGVLEYKNIPVKKDLSAIVFTEVKYNDENNICNLCDKNCDFKINKHIDGCKNKEKWL